MIVKCQQQNILKIRDGIPGHGPQKVGFLYQTWDGRTYVSLNCGCFLPIAWLSTTKQREVKAGCRPVRTKPGRVQIFLPV